MGTVIGAMANPTTGYFTGNWNVNIAAEFEHGSIRKRAEHPMWRSAPLLIVGNR